MKMINWLYFQAKQTPLACARTRNVPMCLLYSDIFYLVCKLNSGDEAQICRIQQYYTQHLYQRWVILWPTVPSPKFILDKTVPASISDKYKKLNFINLFKMYRMSHVEQMSLFGCLLCLLLKRNWSGIS